MNILVITPDYPGQRNVQSSIFVHEQCKELQRRGHIVTVLDPCVVVPNRWNESATKAITQREWEGIQVYSYHTRGIATTKLLSLNQRLYWRHAKKLFSYFRKNNERPDVIYAHFASRAGVAACRLGKRFHIPVVVIEHGGAVMNPQRSSFLKKTLNYTYKNSSAFICVSNKQKACVEGYIGNQNEIMVIPNMVNERYRYYPRKDKPNFVFLSAGNLYKVKRMDALIRAFSKAFDSNEPVELRIAGDGAERGALEKLIINLGRNEQISMLGRLNQAEMLQQYIDCDVFALASEHESFGVAYREALSVGRPIVATDNGGIREGWSEEHGVIIPVNDEEKLKEALQEVYKSYEQYNLRGISENCCKQTSPEVVMSKIERVLQNAAEKEKRNEN